MIDPLGLWSLSITFYSPIGTPTGATLTVGSKDGVSFITLSEVGVGKGMGATFDLSADVPKPLTTTPMKIGSFRLTGGVSVAANISVPFLSYKLDYAATGSIDTDPVDPTKLCNYQYYYGPTSDEKLVTGPTVGAKLSAGGGLYFGTAYRWW